MQTRFFASGVSQDICPKQLQERRKILNDPKLTVSCMAFATNEFVAVGLNKKSIQIVNVLTGSLGKRIHMNYDILKLTSSNQSLMLVTEAAGRISVVSCPDFSLKRTFTQEGSVVDCASMRIDDKAVTTSSQNLIKIWDIRDGRLLQSMATSKRATSLDFDCNDRVVVAAH
jgi:WD40 repeat protein